MKRPIGVFDSGVGGISVLRAIRELLPAEDLLYVADTAHVPYGPKTPEFVQSRAMSIARYLYSHDIKTLVVACNTATAAAINPLRASFVFPIIGVEPAVKPAVEVSRSGVVGVLATPGTLASKKFAELVQRYRHQANVIVQPCKGWVELVEAGQLAGSETRNVIANQVAPLLEANADTLVLGCTHYPFLLPVIRDVVGKDVLVMDNGEAIAKRLAEQLWTNTIKRETGRTGTTRFFTSGDPSRLAALLPTLWGSVSDVTRLPEQHVAMEIAR